MLKNWKKKDKFLSNDSTKKKWNKLRVLDCIFKVVDKVEGKRSKIVQNVLSVLVRNFFHLPVLSIVSYEPHWAKLLGAILELKFLELLLRELLPRRFLLEKHSLLRPSLIFAVELIKIILPLEFEQENIFVLEFLLLLILFFLLLLGGSVLLLRFQLLFNWFNLNVQSE